MPDTWDIRVKPANLQENMLKEDSFFLLLESGDKIVLTYGEEWSTRVKPV
jgi:hypothetical protein